MEGEARMCLTLFLFFMFPTRRHMGGEMVEFYTTFMQESRKTKEISRKSENNVEYIWINQ